jgi:hypothetical protein
LTVAKWKLARNLELVILTLSFESEEPPREALGSLLPRPTMGSLFCASRSGFAGRSFIRAG